MPKAFQLQMPQVRTTYFPFIGGLDQTTPPIEMENGVLRFASNVEVGVRGGYTRAAGYERYSGMVRPSDATFAVLTCTITGSVSLGDVLTDNAGTAFGTVIALPNGQAVLTKTTGSFVAGNIKVGVTVVGTCTGPAMPSASTAALGVDYTALAANVYRALISAVPGSGSVLGVHQYGGNVYAFRNNVGGTEAELYKDSAAGWVNVPLGRELAFTSGGTYEIDEGDVITGATSAATATVQRVALTSGSWAAGTAAGYIVFASQTGTFVAEDLNVGASLNVATIAGDSTAITLMPDGRYEFQNHNFGGQAGTTRAYGCDGVNPGFEFDGTVYVPIHTGMPNDAPTFLRIHKNHLFFAFEGSLQYSGPGAPYQFQPIFGGGELTCGEDITNLLVLPGSENSGAMCVKTENRTFVLYGNDEDDFQLIQYSEESGAMPYTMQYVRSAICLDTSGISTLTTTQRFGNFNDSTVSDRINTYLNEKVNTAVASCIVRKKNQYRLFFSSGDAIFLTYSGDKIIGMTPMLYPNDITCISSLEGASRSEEIYFGSSNGFVYQAEIGTSFDGAEINWYANLAFNHFGGPRQLKKFRKAALEVTGVGYSEFECTSDIGYGVTYFAGGNSYDATSDLQGANWDTFVWDQFFWDGRTLSPIEVNTEGTAENISLIFRGSSDAFQPFTLNAAIVHYTPQRLMR